MSKYANIINLSRPAPPREHPRMSIHDRAAQFVGFRALVGPDTLLNETARYVEKKIELTESEKDELDKKLVRIIADINNCPPIAIRYFVKDAFKDGGEYVSYKGIIKKIDLTRKELTFHEGPTVRVADIISIDGDIF